MRSLGAARHDLGAARISSTTRRALRMSPTAQYALTTVEKSTTPGFIFFFSSLGPTYFSGGGAFFPVGFAGWNPPPGRAAAEAEDWEDEGGSDEGGELSGEEEGESEAWLTEVREPAELIDELMQSLVLLFERGAAKGSELARSGPSLQFIDESLSIPQAVIRVLGACAALGGDRDVGDLLSTRAMEQAKELLELGSWAAARDTGQLRVEGKDYVVQDGDVVEFRFNV